MIDVSNGNQKGFSLIEILIAMAVFAFGILAVAAMQIKAIQGNSFAEGMTEATNVAQNKMEELIALPYDDVQLDDANDDRDAGLDKPTNDEVLAFGNVLIAADGVAGSPDYAQIINDGTRNYYVYWNVNPGIRSKTISVIVAWDERGMHRIEYRYIKN